MFYTPDGISGSTDLLFFSDTAVLEIGSGGYVDGDLIGAIVKPVKNDPSNSSSITAGYPVYISGNVGNSDRVYVLPADASNSSKMPAAGVLKQTLGVNGEGSMVVIGVYDYDTTGLSANASLYVSPGGGLTSIRPTDENSLVQNMARVAKQDSSNGTIIVAGAFRTNDVPNVLSVYQYIQFPDGSTQGTAAGVLGATGFQGNQGNQGNQGVQGFQGNQGNQGNQGLVGATGFQGNQGNQGNQGLVGDTGAQGNQGNQGNQGLVGDTGAQGNQGNQGLVGDIGAQGNQGNQGLVGDTGTQGNQGRQGLVGDTGAQGNQGRQGNQGNQGRQGNQGNQGPSGPVDLTYSSGPPSSPDNGDMWFDSDNGVLAVYINDGDSSQWVEIIGDKGDSVAFATATTGLNADAVFASGQTGYKNPYFKLNTENMPSIVKFAEDIFDQGTADSGAGQTFTLNLNNGSIHYADMTTGATSYTYSFAITGNSELTASTTTVLILRGGENLTLNWTNITWEDSAGVPDFTSATAGVFSFIPFSYVNINNIGWVGGSVSVYKP